MEKFADFAQEEPLDGDKIKMIDIVNKEIIVIGYNITNSKYQDENTNKCLKLQIILDDRKYIVFTGSVVLIEQIEKYKEHIPFTTVITRINKFYSFT